MKTVRKINVNKFPLENRMEDFNTLLSYFAIDYLSKHDGPGNRVVLFLQGCSLDCFWCHSPHSQPQESPLLYFSGNCTQCQRCAESCQNEVHSFIHNQHSIHRDLCLLCGRCVDDCPQSSRLNRKGALVLPTITEEVTKLFQKIKPQLELLGDEGGITFSGGEPLLQSASVAQLAALCKKAGFHTALETSGVVNTKWLEMVFPFIDTWLVGMRTTTGTGTYTKDFLEQKLNESLHFLRVLNDSEVIARIPAIPHHTDDGNYLECIHALIKKYKISNLEVLPLNPESNHYYEASGLESPLLFDPQSAEDSHQFIKTYFNGNISINQK